MREITGFVNAASLARPPLVSRSYSFCESALSRLVSNWLISAPEMNALLPAPVRTTTRTELSSRNSSRISPNPAHISTDIALSFSGWLNVITPTPSSHADNILPPAYCLVPLFVLAVSIQTRLPRMILISLAQEPLGRRASPAATPTSAAAILRFGQERHAHPQATHVRDASPLW